MTYLDPLITGATLRERLEHRLGHLIRQSQLDWPELPLDEKRRRVDEFRLLRDSLGAVTGESRPAIPCPWTPDEVAASMGDALGGWFSTVGMLDVETSRLVTAVRVTERTLRKYGRRPKTLNCPARSNIDHLTC